MKHFKLKLVAVLAVVLAVVGWLAVRALTPANTVPPEKVVKVERGDIARSVVAVGQIEPRSKVEVKSKANGILQALLADVGDQVKEGQVLAELDKEDLEAQVREARAFLDSEEANLKVAMASEGRARVEVANPELEFTERDYQRVQSLFAQRIASQQALDDAQRAYEMARNRRQLLAAEVTSAEARVIQARARVAAARAALDRAEENQRYATIRSPIDGIVLARDTEVGDAVSSILNLGSMATLIMTLGDLSTVYVKGEVDEAEIGRIRADLPVRTRVESFPDETFPGTVTRLAPMGKKQNNVTTFEARVSISNPQGRLRVHMSAHAEIILEEHKQALLVPEAALLYDKDRRASVQRLDPSAKTGFRKIAVQTGISNGRKTEILGGLAENDALVLP